MKLSNRANRYLCFLIPALSSALFACGRQGTVSQLTSVEGAKDYVVALRSPHDANLFLSPYEERDPFNSSRFPIGARYGVDTGFNAIRLSDLNGGSLNDGDRITLRFPSGYLASEGDSGNLTANRASAGEWETFTLRLPAGGTLATANGEIALTDYRGKFIALEPSALSVKVCDDHDPERPGSRVCPFQVASHNVAVANRDARGEWETLRIQFIYDFQEYARKEQDWYQHHNNGRYGEPVSDPDAYHLALEGDFNVGRAFFAGLGASAELAEKGAGYGGILGRTAGPQGTLTGIVIGAVGGGLIGFTMGVIKSVEDQKKEYADKRFKAEVELDREWGVQREKELTNPDFVGPPRPFERPRPDENINS